MSAATFSDGCRAGLAGLVSLALVGCSDRSAAPVVPEAFGVGTNHTVFAVSTRSQNPDGTFGFERSDDTNFLELVVSVPPTHQPGDLKFGYANPDPETQFTLASRKVFANDAAFATRVSEKLSRLPPGSREISIFIHGYNATQAETAFRAAQIAHDIEVPGVKMIYSWPSRGAALGYVYDHDSMLFARDGFEDMLRSAGNAGLDRIVLVAHSMGGLLTMETLRQIELQTPGWTKRNIAGLIMIAPDIDVTVFRTQVERMPDLPDPFIVFTSQRDAALNLSSLLRGGDQRDRLGNINNVAEVADIPIMIVDTTEFSFEADSTHLVAVTSPTLISMLADAERINQTFEDGSVPINEALEGETTNVPGGRAQFTRLSANDSLR